MFRLLNKLRKTVRTIKRVRRTAAKAGRTASRLNSRFTAAASVLAIVATIIISANAFLSDHFSKDNAVSQNQFWKEAVDLAEKTAVKGNRREDTNTKSPASGKIKIVSTACTRKTEFSLSDVKKWDGKTPSVEVNGNKPYFSKETIKKLREIKLSKLDDLGRCGRVIGYFGPETIASGERGSIGHIRPSGWKQAKYPGVVDSSPGYLYNRAHLVMWKLSGILDDERNLITGTRYMNTEGMLPYEEQLVAYVQATGNHVIYRVTPVFKGKELVARGVLMEAYSVEDNGKGIRFCVYCYNSQPEISINYTDGSSKQK